MLHVVLMGVQRREIYAVLFLTTNGPSIIMLREVRISILT